MTPAGAEIAAAARAKTVMQRLETLARISEEPGRLTRTFGSPAMQQANAVVSGWMRQAGMSVRQDPIGNLLGNYPAGPNDSGKVLLLGSHLDTVRDAGKFDGALGVLVAIACIEQLHRHHTHLPFA